MFKKSAGFSSRSRESAQIFQVKRVFLSCWKLGCPVGGILLFSAHCTDFCSDTITSIIQDIYLYLLSTSYQLFLNNITMCYIVLYYMGNEWTWEWRGNPVPALAYTFGKTPKGPSGLTSLSLTINAMDPNPAIVVRFPFSFAIVKHDLLPERGIPLINDCVILSKLFR